MTKIAAPNLAIRFINLDTRSDRKLDLTSNFRKHGFDVDKARIAGVVSPELPMMGCSQGHIRAIEDFVKKSDADFLMVLEDDWRFTVDSSLLLEVLGLLTKQFPKWNVLQLSATDAIFDEIGSIILNSQKLAVVRIFKATSLAAYVVRRKFAPELQKYFSESVKMCRGSFDKLIQTNQAYYAPGGNQNQKVVHDKVGLLLPAGDHAWGRGQLEHTFLGLGMQFGFCDDSESSISPFKVDNQERQLWRLMEKLHNPQP